METGRGPEDIGQSSEAEPKVSRGGISFRAELTPSSVGLLFRVTQVLPCIRQPSHIILQKDNTKKRTLNLRSILMCIISVCCSIYVEARRQLCAVCCLFPPLHRFLEFNLWSSGFLGKHFLLLSQLSFCQLWWL